MSNAQQIAETILAQLGGARFVAMTGASNMLHGEKHLQCKLGRGALNGITHLTVALRDDDSYDVTFHRVAKRGLDVREISRHEMVFADSLRTLVESVTGFYLNL